MKWINMRFFLAFVFLTFVLFSVAHSSATCLQEKIILIDSELCYCRYLIYEAKHDGIDKMIALETIDEILEVVFSQLKEINSLELSQD